MGMGLTMVLMMGAMSLFVQTSGHYKDGTEHVDFISDARKAQQIIWNKIQDARAVSVTAGTTTSLDLVQPDLVRSRLYYVEGQTQASNRLVYDADVTLEGDEFVVAQYVSEIPDTPMFRVVEGTQNTTLISLYIGLRPPENAKQATSIRKSYTGSILHLTASPRNVVYVIQQ